MLQMLDMLQTKVPTVKSVCVYIHAQTKWPTASKFDTEILKRFLRWSQSDFLKYISTFFRMDLKYIFLDFSANYSYISRFLTFLRCTRGLQLINLV